MILSGTQTEKMIVNKRKYFVFIGLLLAFSNTFACECFPIDSLSAENILKDYEFAIIGSAIKNINYSPEINEMWDSSKQGYEVVIVVDSVIKGDLSSKEIVINQFSNGNCSQIFEFGKPYLILGNRLSTFINRTPDLLEPEDGEILVEYPPPPPNSIQNSTMYCFNNDQEEIDYWNELASEYLVLYTSQCVSFETSRRYASYFLKK